MDAPTQEYENKLCWAFQAQVCMHTLYYYNLTGLLSLQPLQQIAFPVYLPFYKDITNTTSLNLATSIFKRKSLAHKEIKVWKFAYSGTNSSKIPQLILTPLYKKGKKLVQMAPGY